MTKKLFVATAKIVASIPDLSIRQMVAKEFAALFRSENPRFDTYRFLSACDVKQGKYGSVEV